MDKQEKKQEVEAAIVTEMPPSLLEKVHVDVYVKESGLTTIRIRSKLQAQQAPGEGAGEISPP